MLKEIREIYVALARAAETGDALKLGLTVGQILPKLEEMSKRATGTVADAEIPFWTNKEEYEKLMSFRDYLGQFVFENKECK